MKPTVVLTRPEGNNAGLRERLEQAGWNVVAQPLLQITPVESSSLPATPAFPADSFCLFISANAVRIGLPLLSEAIRVGQPRLLAVGRATAAAIADAGFEAIIPEQADSEGLLSLPILQNVLGSKVVIVKGEGGRGLLADVLRQRGAEVEEFVCYHRQPVSLDAGEFCWRLCEHEAVVFQANSGETLQQLTDLLGRGGQPNLLDRPVLVPSARVAQLAQESGWTQVINTNDASDEAFVTALQSLAGSMDDTALAAETLDPSTTGDSAMTEKDGRNNTPDAPEQSTGAPETLKTPGAGPGRLESEYFEKVIEGDAPPPPRRSDWLARALLLLLLLALGGAGFMGWSRLLPQWQAQQQSLSALESQLTGLQKDRAVLVEQLGADLNTRMSEVEARTAASLKEQLAAAARVRAETEAAGSALEQRLDRLEIRLARLTATDRRAWLANEAAFLVRLAAQRLLASRDVAAAQALLRNADALLAEADDPRLDASRRALAADLTALTAAPRVDAVGLYARFAALAGQAAALDVVVAPEQGGTTLAEDAGWLERAEAGWQAALAKLSDYLIIRRRDHEMARLMTPDWEVLVRQNLRMLLEQAQIAALSGNQTLFNTALDRALVFVQEFTETDPDRASAIAQEIQTLRQTNISPELPDLITSRAAIADAIRLMDGDVRAEAAEPSAVVD